MLHLLAVLVEECRPQDFVLLANYQDRLPQPLWIYIACDLAPSGVVETAELVFRLCHGHPSNDHDPLRILFGLDIMRVSCSVMSFA